MNAGVIRLLAILCIIALALIAWCATPAKASLTVDGSRCVTAVKAARALRAGGFVAVLIGPRVVVFVGPDGSLAAVWRERTCVEKRGRSGDGDANGRR